jgi:hypothetical protein
MKTISIFLALINSLLSGLFITFLISSPDFQISATWWSILRILVASTVIVIAFLTWADGMSHVHAGLMALAGIALIAIGTGTVVWIMERILMTGHFEYRMIVYGGSLFVEGIALLFSLSEKSRTISPA